MKKALKIFRGIIVAIAALLFAVCIMLQVPTVQTFVAKKAVERIENSLRGRIVFSKIHFKPFNAIVLKDVALIDSYPPIIGDGEKIDTIASARSIVATFSLKGLLRKEGIHINRASVSEGTLFIVNDGTETNLSRFINSSGDSAKVKKEAGNVFNAKKVQVDNFRFRIINTLKDTAGVGYGINWNNLDVTVDKFRAGDLNLSHGYFKGVLEDLEAREKSGLTIKSLSGKTRIGHGRTLIQDLRLRDGSSDLDIPEFSMTCDSSGSFKNFLDEVKLTGNLVKSKVSFSTLSYFVPTLKDRNIVLGLDLADFEGTISNLGINRIQFSEKSSGISGALEGILSGLPDTKKIVLDINAEDLRFTTEGLSRLARGFSPGTQVDLSRFAKDEKMVFNGRVSGPVNGLVFDGRLDSGSMGSAETKLRVNNLMDNIKPTNLKGSIVTNRLDLGKAAGVSQLGEVTLRGVVGASIGKGQTDFRIDTLFIDRLNALGYEYSNIRAAGTYSQNAFDGRIVCNDPNLNFLFQGKFSLADKSQDGIYKFYANIGYADLQALGIDRRGISKVSGKIDANYINTKREGVIGDLDVVNLILENDLGRHNVGDICIKSHSSGDIHRIILSSDFANGTFVGNKQFTGIINDIQELTTRRELPVLYKDLSNNWNGEEYDLELKVHDARDLLSFVLPGLYIADSTIVNLNVGEDGGVRATVRSPRIALGENYLRNINLALDNKDGSLNGAVSSTEATFAGMTMKRNSILLYANDNHIGFGCSYDNLAESADKGEVYLTGELERSDEGELLIHGKTLPSYISYNDDIWTIGSSSIDLVGKNLKINNLTASSSDQSISISGGFATTRPDTLMVDLNKFDMALANRFIGDGYGISGLATGKALVTSPWRGNAGLLLDITCDSTSIAGHKAGTIRVESTLDDAGVMRFNIRNNLGGAKTIDVAGNYFTKDGRIDAYIMLDNFNTGYAAPALASVFSETRGSMSGKIRVSGKTDDLHLSSEDARVDNLLLKIGFTNVPYYVSGPFHIDDQGVHFDDLAIKDRTDGSGTISGGILFRKFKDIRMDTRIRVRRMEAIDMGESGSSAFYGNLFATGDVSVTGPLDAIQIDVDARTDKNGRIHIPIDNASIDGKNGLLTFIEDKKEIYTDPYDVMMNRLVKDNNKASDLGLRIRIRADQGTEAHLEIDRTAGNVLTGRGQGNLDIQVRPGRDLFTINGDYTLNSGNFHFNAMDIAKRNFTISEGSSIRFNGDVMDSDLDIEGVYSTKTSVATLIADTTSMSSRRTVNCGIGISGKLREPQLKFSIDVPDLDPTTKSKVESALNTEDKVQRQFISLLISGGFIPDEQSGVVNNSSMLYSNVAEIMAGQLNSILQKLDIPLDLGLNYQANDSGTNIFDVAVSTQLFNNRVIVNGNVGNREYGNSSSEGDVVGDVDIEIKLDRPGQLRLTLFSHSADDYTSYLDNTQRSGVGIAYQREFNNFAEFIRDLFTRRRKREQRASDIRQESVPRQERAMNRIVITAGDSK